jgi:hypothetical protein
MSLADALVTHRTAIVALIGAIDDPDVKLTALDHLPPQLHPPIALVEPADPYLTDSGQAGYGAWTLGYDVYLVAERGTSDAMTHELDRLIGLVVDAVDTDTYDVTRVARPYGLDVKNTRGTAIRYLATRVSVTTTITT